MADVILKSLTKSFGPGLPPVVDSATFEARDREFLVLVGPSGCGKSTTLRMIAGLEEPTSGEIFIAGKNVTRTPPKDRDIAMVFQNYALYPHLSVHENLSFSLKLRKVPKNEIHDRVQRAAQILNIEPLLERRPRELSGGQRQRVALGRALVREPKVFLFDEPLSNLDAKLRVQMRTEILKLHQQLQVTIIYVTHDQMEAMTMGDRIVVMKDGLVQQVEEPLEIYHHPVNQFVAGFIGSPPINFLPIAWKNGGAEIYGESLPPAALSFLDGLGVSSAPKMMLGVRPENIHLGEDGPGDIRLEATLEISEEMGHETLHYLRFQDLTLTARVMGKPTRLLPGSRVRVNFRLEDCLWFDETGRTVRQPKTGRPL